MALFDFFKSGSDKPKIDLNDLKFISDDHIRYQNGKDATGHNYDCWRGIRIQDNISGSSGYTVTVYNLDGKHPVWGNNIQMSPKQMKIIEQTNSLIKLKGFGSDSLGSSYADYGLTLILNNNAVEKITLHLYDRKVDIEYFKSREGRTDMNMPLIPSTDVLEIMSLAVEIGNSQDLATLRYLYSQKGNYNHPQICCCFGVAFSIKGDRETAKKAFIKGASYGVQYPCSLYPNALVDSVGQCLTFLMMQFPITNHENAVKATALSYIYLSRCIELHPNQSFDSYNARASLLVFHATPSVAQRLILDSLGISFLSEPFIISDFFFAATLPGSPHVQVLQNAKKIHSNLDDMTIGGKDADEYSLNEMAEFGQKRHFTLFKKLEQKYNNGDFDLTMDELNKLFK
jgi:hypothetical protein